MILNIGSGADLHPDAINIDIRPVADLQADVTRLPFPDESCAELRAYDLLEHFPRTQTATILKEWHRVLKPGGRLILRVPNLHALATQIGYWGDKDGPQLEALLDNVYGGHKWGDFDTHHWGWTPYSLSQTLDTAGFTVEDNDLSLNMVAAAVKE